VKKQDMTDEGPVAPTGPQPRVRDLQAQQANTRRHVVELLAEGDRLEEDSEGLSMKAVQAVMESDADAHDEHRSAAEAKSREAARIREVVQMLHADLEALGANLAAALADPEHVQLAEAALTAARAVAVHDRALADTLAAFIKADPTGQLGLLAAVGDAVEVARKTGVYSRAPLLLVANSLTGRADIRTTTPQRSTQTVEPKADCRSFEGRQSLTISDRNSL
jgi:hypothetical protein